MASRSEMTVNGARRRVALGAARSLLDVLRDDFELHGAKPGCGEGACGACTVLIDGQPVRACVTEASAAAGRSVRTVEGLAGEEGLHPVQQALIDEGAIQCGYCTPGMVLAGVALLERNPDPDRADIRAALRGNVCRCCAYGRIERAMLRAAETIRTAEPSPPAAGSPRRADFWEFRPRTPWDLSAPEEREYFELLGDGLVVVLAPGRRPRPGWPAFAFEGGGTWLHVGADRTVTAFTGKVDVGQDNRTALSLIVADELRVAAETVRLVMGDTDLCPADMGTFGSRSLPDAGEDLRVCAASARQLLDRIPDLSRVRRIEPAMTDVPLLQATARRYYGRPAARVTGRELVTGEHSFPSDLTRPGMLHGLLLRAPAYGATLSYVETGAASAIPGVTVLHEGDLVAVAAADQAVARRALAAIDADWSSTDHIQEQDLAEHLRSHPIEVLGWGGPVHDEQGDVDGALAAADVRLDATYTTAYIAHVSLETRVALAEWTQGRLTVWTGTQQPYFVRSALAAALEVGEADVRVIVPALGGGFGSKHTEDVAIAAAWLARAAGRPVKVVLSREDEFRFSYMRPAAVIDVRSGACKDGTITAWDFANVNSGAAALASPYVVANQRIAFEPADSPLPQGPYRALAATANHFARESHIDELANALGIDPLKLRLRHLDDERLAAVLRAAAERSGWSKLRRTSARGHGVGIAAGIEKGGRVATCAHVRVRRGELEILEIVTAYDCGAIVNPDNVERQIEGAIVMGLGGALFEAIHFDAGRILNPSMHTYRVPRFTDVPPIDVLLHDHPEAPSAGAGETPIVAVAPALANALFAATGRRLRSLPLLRDGLVPDTDAAADPAISSTR